MTIRMRVSANFERNLESIRCYWHDERRPERFEVLLDLVFDEIAPNLVSYPLMGRDLLARLPDSLEADRLRKQLATLVPANAGVREYISPEYLVLYLLESEKVTLLAIRHHAQLSFDLKGLYGN